MAVPLQHLPVANPRPDIAEFLGIIAGTRQSQRVPLVEYIVDEAVMRPVVTDLLGRTWVPYGPGRESQRAYWDNFIAFWHGLGYDFVRFEQSLPFCWGTISAGDTAPGVQRDRLWADEHRGPIQSWADFERYPWPGVADADFFALEYLSTHLPEGMGLFTCHGGGIFEHVSRLFSLEGLCIALCEDPELVGAVIDKAGKRMLDYYRQLAQLDNLAALFQGDDMGFRTQTLVAPDDLIRFFLPWHKAFAKVAHDAGVPYFLHSCGQVDAIMGPLLDDVGIDAKHSFEDAITPVEHFHGKYAERIGVLGGVDLNILTQGSAEEVRRRARFLMDTCGRKGRYAIGSGNSIPSYIPVDNYLALVDEANGFRVD